MSILRLLLFRYVTIHCGSESMEGYLIDITYSEEDQDYEVMLDWGFGTTLKTITDIYTSVPSI